jgi:hypothetical protein
LQRSAAKCERLSAAVASDVQGSITLAEHEDILAEVREAAAAELAAARESSDVMLADAEKRHGEALDAERRSHRAALEAAKTEASQALEALRAALEADAAAARQAAQDRLAALEAAHRDELASQDARAAAALAAARDEAAAALDAAREEAARALAAARKEAAAGLDAAREEAWKALAATHEERAAALAAARKEAALAAVPQRPAPAAPPEEERPAPPIVEAPRAPSPEPEPAAASPTKSEGYFDAHGYEAPPTDSPVRYVEAAVKADSVARAITRAVAELLGASDASDLADTVAKAANVSHEQAASKALELLKPLTISEETDEEDVDEPPVIESDAAFETRLASFLEDDCPTLADAAGDLGRLGVERRTYLELQEKVEGNAVVEARLEAIDAFADEILENTSSWSVESLAVCRHENALLAKKARAMAGWLSAVHGSSDDEKMVIYEEAASALAKEIEARGGWRAACTLAGGGLNESVDLVPWPDRDALRMCSLLKDHFQLKYNAAEALRLELSDENESLTKRLKLVEQRLETSTRRRDVLERQLRGALAQKRPPRQQILSADDVHSEKFDLDAYLGRGGPRTAAAHIDAGPVLKAWQEERISCVTQRVEVAKVLAAVMASPLAEAVQSKLPAIDISVLTEARAEAFRSMEVEEDPLEVVEEAPAMGLDGTACLPQLTGDAVRSVPPTVSRPVSSSRHEVAKNHRGRAPLFPDISRPASALAPQTPPKVDITYKSSRVEAARRLLEKVRRGMRGLGGYSGSDAQSEALTQEVKACLTHDEGDLRTLLRVFALVQKRHDEQRDQIELLQRELNITASTEVERLRRMRDLEKAHDDTAVLYQRLQEAQSDADRYKAEADAVRDSMKQGIGALEQLEATICVHRDAAEVHGALLPRYHEADLRAAEAMARATSLKDKADAQEKVKARDLLERRLLLVFNEVRSVEDAMLALYERVETATQYVFSGQSYRELLVWAADKEEGNVDDAEGALRLKQSIAKAAAPARQLLPKSDPLAPKPPSTGVSGRDRYAQLARFAGNVATPASSTRPRPSPAKKSPRRLKPVAGVSGAARPIM